VSRSFARSLRYLMVSLLPARVSSDSAAMANPWPYLSPTCRPLIVKLLLNAITSPSVRTGAPAGSLARYAFRSRLNPKSRTVEQFAGIGKPPQPLKSRSEEHTSELQSLTNLVCRLLLEKNNVRT